MASSFWIKFNSTGDAMWLNLLCRMRSLWRNREGSALVEATVVVPVLFTLTFGVFEFSWLFYSHQLVSAGIRDAARYASKAANPCDATIVTDAQNLATTGQIASGGTARVAGWTAGSVNITCASVDNSTGTYRGGNSITIVTASTSFADNSLGYFPFLGLTVPTISVSHSERGIQDTPNP
jgi:Flp pilus assembly protein TadG